MTPGVRAETVVRLVAHGLLVGCLAGVATGCGAHLQPGAAPEAAADRRAYTDDGGYLVVYESTPDPVPFNRPFELTVVVLDARDLSPAAPGVEVDVRATMPAHGHGMNLVPQVDAAGAGRFTVHGMLFHMPGRWEIEIEVRTGDGGPERARFPIEVT